MISRDLQSDIRAAMAGLKGTAARHAATEISTRTGVSVRQIYKLTADLRDRRTRADKGARRVGLSEDVTAKLMRLVHEKGFDAQLALDTAIGSGLVTAENAPSQATLLRWMRQKGIGAGSSDNNRVCRRWEADYPNQLHQCDSTISATFYLDKDGTVGYEPLKDQSNKPGNSKPRLHLFALIDDYSRVAYARYYYADNTLNWLDFLWHAWGPKDDPARFPFEGLPEVLYTDNGSTLKSERMRLAMKTLGVEQKFHAPYHAQAKGKVERLIGVIQQKLEKLYLLQKPRSLDEANAILETWLLKRNLRAHGTTGVVPFQRWIDRSDAVRRLPGDHILRALNCTRMTRILSVDLTFTVNGETFQAPYQEPFISMPRGQQVVVEYAPECPFEVNLIVGRASIAALHVAKGKALPVALPAAAEAKTETAESSARVRAAGLEDLKPFGALDLPTPDMKFMPQRAESVEISEPVAEAMLSDVKTVRALQSAGIVALPADAPGLALAARVMNGAELVPQSTVDAFIAQHKGKSARSVLAELAAAEPVAPSQRLSVSAS